MPSHDYFMESDEETRRLEVKTDEEDVRRQALWAGLRAGMRVADLGCGPGKTTRCLNGLVQPGGETVGVDIVSERVAYAMSHYSESGTSYICRDIRQPLKDLGTFDFVWVRFVLEYYMEESSEIVRNIADMLKPGGILCLIDLDHNCLSHYGFTDRFESAYTAVMNILIEKADFDPWVGRKLYAFLYDSGFVDIDVRMSAHHLIFGSLRETDGFNWTRKVEGAARQSGYDFPEYEGGYDAFMAEFKQAFADPRRFTYTPLIACRGVKPE